MSVLELNLDRYQEPIVVESGEYQLKLTSLQLKKSAANNEYLAASFDVLEHPDAATVFHNFMLPNGADEKVDNAWGLRLRKFFEAFGIDYKDMKVGKDDKAIGVKGNIGWVYLGIETDPEYGTRNIVKRIIVPKAGA